MILDHMEFFEDVNLEKGLTVIRAMYNVRGEAVCDISTDDHTKRDIKVELAKDVQKQMVKDLSGFFDDSFTDEDVFYITHINKKMLDDMRKLAELTIYTKVEDVEKLIHIYEALKDLGIFSKEQK